MQQGIKAIKKVWKVIYWHFKIRNIIFEDSNIDSIFIFCYTYFFFMMKCILGIGELSFNHSVSWYAASVSFGEWSWGKKVNRKVPFVPQSQAAAGWLQDKEKKNKNKNVVVVLVFYGPSTLFMSFRARSVYLSTLFLGKSPRQLTSTWSHSFASNWQLPFLNQRKGENGHRKRTWNARLFKPQSHIT